MKKIFVISGLLMMGVIILVVSLPHDRPRITLVNTTNTDVKNIAYTIDNEIFTLVNGRAEKTYTPDSATKNILSIFGEPKYGDLDTDGDEDAAILLAHDPGGSGTFYYAVLAVNNAGNYQATNALLLGDRITPQTVDILYGSAVYNFFERESSSGLSVWIDYDQDTRQISELFGPETFVSAQVWPPEISITSEVYTCTGTESQINNRTYCITSITEGAAGTRYIDYNYLTVWQNKLISLRFVLRYPVCENYADQPMIDKCQQGQASLDIDAIVDKIVQSF